MNDEAYMQPTSDAKYRYEICELQKRVAELESMLRVFQSKSPNAMKWCAAAHAAEARCAELEAENTLQAATINGLRLPRCDMDGRTLEELSKENATLRDENARLCRLLADAAKEGE